MAWTKYFPMADTKPFRDPAALFSIGALCLVAAGIVAWVAAAPVPATQVTATNPGGQLLRAAALFGICAALYFLFKQLSWKLNALLGQLHFWMSALAALLQPILTYGFSLESHPVPGHSAFSLLMDSFVGATAASMWALLVFVLAQLVFLANICWTLLNTLSNKSGSTPTA